MTLRSFIDGLLMISFRGVFWKTFYSARSFAASTLDVLAYSKVTRNFSNILPSMKNVNVLKYTLDNGDVYRVVFPNKRGVRKWIRVVNGENNDVTNELVSFAGPCHNFHGIPSTPYMLGYDALTFEFSDGTTKTFTENTFIEI